LDELMTRIGARFRRLEPRHRARAFVLGLLSELPRKDCWTIPEQCGDAIPDWMQYRLARPGETPPACVTTCAAMSRNTWAIAKAANRDFIRWRSLPETSPSFAWHGTDATHKLCKRYHY
jgi:hypothetical protein